VATDNLGATATSAPVTVTVSEVTAGVKNVTILAGTDDAEEYAKGTVLTGDADIDLVYDSKTSGLQTVGLYFRNLGIPAGSVVTRAYIQFTAFRKTTASCSLIISGEDRLSPDDFTSGNYNLSSRAKTFAKVPWVPPGWTKVGVAQQSPDLASLINEIISDNSGAAIDKLVFLITNNGTGTGTRAAYSYESSPASAALLHMEYSAATSGDALKSLVIKGNAPAIPADLKIAGIDVQLYPNPVGDKLNVRVNGDAYLEQIEIYNVQSVLMVRRKMTAGLNEAILDCSDLVPGTYVALIKTSRGGQVVKFIRE
jgi:hypothetical protein